MTPQPDGNNGNPYMRPVNTKTKCQNFLQAVWNPEDKTLLGRTARGWGLLLIFYSIFYAVLAAMFAICMYALLKIVPADQPMFTLSHSRIGENPGLGFRPQFVDEGSLIWYNVKNETQIAKYVNQLNEWLDVYTNTSHPGASSRVPCDFSLSPHQLRQACIVNTTSFGPCSAQHHYGYTTTKPCIFIKLNRIYNWEPDYYTDSSVPSMPSDLKAYIDKQDANERKQVWISCYGEDPGDREGLNYNLDLSTNVSYYPSQGIPWYYFPYRNQPGYVNPIVAVQFTNLEPGRIINIRCRAWAKNIEYSHSLRVLSGSTHIEIMVDDQ